MSKGETIGFRISDNMRKTLEQQAEAEGCTLSDVARNIMTEHVRVEDLLLALQEIRKSHSQEMAQLREEMKTLMANFTTIKRGNISNEDTAEIRRIVTLIARAMPSVARSV